MSAFSEALARLPQYNGDPKTPSNPYGMNDQGYLVNIPQMVDDIATVCGEVADAAEIVGNLETEIADLGAVSAQIVTLAPYAVRIGTLAALSSALSTLAAISANITTAATNSANITAVAGNATNINTVATAVSNINSVAAALTNINLVAAALANIATVVSMAANIATVAGASTAIGTVSTNIASVNTAAAANSNIGTVAANIGNVNTVAGISAAVTTVAADSAKISTVAGDTAKLATLAPVSTAISAVATNIANVNTTAGAVANINIVAGIAANVTAVAAVASDISAVIAATADLEVVSDNIAAVQTTASNIAAVLAAPTQASNAAASASAAQAAELGAKRSALFQEFDSGTSDANPGSGAWRLNNATPSAATVLYVSSTETTGGDITDWVATWDDSDNPGNRGEVTFIDSANNTNWLKVIVNGANTTASGYRKIAISYVDHNGTLTDGALFSIEFARSGNQGTSGGGTGTVVTTGSVVDGRIAVYDGTSGNNIKDGGKVVADFATAAQGALAATALQPAAVGVTVQAYDADLLAIAGLTSAANKLPYFTGSGTAALADLTSAGRALIDDADAAAQRATLGLVIGTNVQAYDAELAALAGLTSAVDTMPYFTGSGTASLASLTAAGRALMDDADTAAQRTTLGVVIGTNVQAYDAELAAIAGLTSAADRLPYFTGLGSAALATFTTFGRSLVDDADALAARATLGVVIGTDVQAYDADLADIAANVTAAGLAFIKAANVTAQTALLNAATASLPGIVELATVAEAGGGTDTVRAVTPAGLFPAAATVASGGTCNIGAAASSLVQITGTTTITAFDTVAAGIKRSGWFAGILTLTHNATSLILPGGANITTAANDRFDAVSLGSGNWLVLNYVKASGASVISAGGGGWTAVGSAVATTSGSSVTFSSLPTDAMDFGFVFNGLKSVAGGTLLVEISANGSTWSTAIEGNYVDATDASYGDLVIDFYRASAGTLTIGQITTASSPTLGGGTVGYPFRCTGGISAVRFSLSSSTFNAGSIQAYKR